MQYLYYAALFILLYVYMGLGLTLVVCPKSLKKFALLLSPVVGYCYLTLVGWYCYTLDIGGTDTYALLILFPPLLFLIFSLLKKQRQTTDLSILFNKELVVPLLVGTILFLVLSLPLITNTHELTSISITNGDIADSAGISRYLKEFARSAKVGFLGQSTIFQYNADKFIFGGPLSTAFISSIFSLEPYQIQSMSLHIFFLFGLFLIYALAREAFRYNQHAAIGMMALYGMNPIMYYTIYQGFQGQIIATTLSLCIFLIHIHAINISNKFSDYYSYIPLAVLFNWGFNLTYAHMLPFIYLLLFVHLVLLNIYTKVWATALRWISFTIITLIITFVLSPYRAKAFLTMFLFAGSAQAGWYMPLFPPEAILGLTIKNLNIHYYTCPIIHIYRIPLLLIFAIGFVNAYKNDRTLFYLAGSSVFVILTGYIILSFIGRTDVGWGGYKSYKFLSFFLPLVLLSFMILFRNIKFNPEHRILYILPLSFAVLIIFIIHSSLGISEQMLRIKRVVSKDMADLKKIESDPLIESVNILGSDYWDILWQTNFLMRKKLYFETSTYAGRTQSKLEGQWDLLRLSKETIFDGDTIPINSSYVVKKVKRPPEDSWRLIQSKPFYSLSLAVFGNRLYMAAKGFKNNNIYIHSMTDSGTWSLWSQIPGATTHSPALTVFKNRLYMAVKGAADYNIYICYMKDSGTWTPWTQVPGATTHSPTLAVLNDRLYIAAKGATDYNIYICYMKDSGTWTPWTQVPGATTHSPALAVLNDRLYIAVQGATIDNIYICYMRNPDTWSHWVKVPGRSIHPPALTVFNNRLYLAVKGTTIDNIYICYMEDPGNWKSWIQVSR